MKKLALRGISTKTVEEIEILLKELNLTLPDQEIKESDDEFENLT